MKEIIIKKIEEKNNDYVAYYKNTFLKTTFFICFTDSICGAVALNRFAEMIKNNFNEKDINLFISDEKIEFKSKAILDEITKINKEEAIL